LHLLGPAGLVRVSTPGRGTPVTLRLAADGAGLHGAPNEPLKLGPFKVSAGAPVTVLANWRNLAAGAVLQWRNHGKLIRLRMSNRLRIPSLARITAVKLSGHPGQRTLTVRTLVRRLPSGSSLTVVWAILRGHRVLRLHTVRIRSPRPGRRTDAFSFRLPGGRGLRAVVGVVAASSSSTPVVTRAQTTVPLR
jgi:hypothetical protein